MHKGFLRVLKTLRGILSNKKNVPVKKASHNNCTLLLKPQSAKYSMITGKMCTFKKIKIKKNTHFFYPCSQEQQKSSFYSKQL